MTKLVWEKGSDAHIEAVSDNDSSTILDVIRGRRTLGKTYDLVRIRQDNDDIRFTKSELQSLVSYLNSVIPTMKDL